MTKKRSPYEPEPVPTALGLRQSGSSGGSHGKAASLKKQKPTIPSSSFLFPDDTDDWRVSRNNSEHGTVLATDAEHDVMNAADAKLAALAVAGSASSVKKQEQKFATRVNGASGYATTEHRQQTQPAYVYVMRGLLVPDASASATHQQCNNDSAPHFPKSVAARDTSTTVVNGRTLVKPLHDSSPVTVNQAPIGHNQEVDRGNQQAAKKLSADLLRTRYPRLVETIGDSARLSPRLRPITWLLKLMEGIYDAFFSDVVLSSASTGNAKVDMETPSPRPESTTIEKSSSQSSVTNSSRSAKRKAPGTTVALPTFTQRFLQHSLGLPALADQDCLDLVYNIEVARERFPEVSLFSNFLRELFDSDALKKQARTSSAKKYTPGNLFEVVSHPLIPDGTKQVFLARDGCESVLRRLFSYTMELRQSAASIPIATPIFLAQYVVNEKMKALFSGSGKPLIPIEDFFSHMMETFREISEDTIAQFKYNDDARLQREHDIEVKTSALLARPWEEQMEDLKLRMVIRIQRAYRARKKARETKEQARAKLRDQIRERDLRLKNEQIDQKRLQTLHEKDMQRHQARLQLKKAQEDQAKAELEAKQKDLIKKLRDEEISQRNAKRNRQQQAHTFHEWVDFIQRRYKKRQANKVFMKFKFLRWKIHFSPHKNRVRAAMRIQRFARAQQERERFRRVLNLRVKRNRIARKYLQKVQMRQLNTLFNQWCRFTVSNQNLKANFQSIIHKRTVNWFQQWVGFIALWKAKKIDAANFIQRVYRGRIARQVFRVQRIRYCNALTIQRTAWRKRRAKQLAASIRTEKILLGAFKGGYSSTKRAIASGYWYVVDQEGNGILHMAAAAGHKRSIKLCLRNRMDVNVTNRHSQTPLHLLLANLPPYTSANERNGDRIEKVALAAYMIDHGAWLEAPDEDGFTPLLLCAALCQTEAVEMLLEHEANTDALSPSGGLNAAQLSVGGINLSLLQDVVQNSKR
ncbi:Ankyrin repeat, partial [Globisporangium splendens]